jgi:hypothetical protein
MSFDLHQKAEPGGKAEKLTRAGVVEFRLEDKSAASFFLAMGSKINVEAKRS